MTIKIDLNKMQDSYLYWVFYSCCYYYSCYCYCEYLGDLLHQEMMAKLNNPQFY